ncbi:MAG: aminotransferase class III-fold pyridoxal phosphate-dependent enzyme [Beijerinckiaceae bacterium]|nr:aminotransferase class III-fold pyridoxal phosphate-dependent enzyme [Beijerinckiaceae bacterium]
MSALPGGISSLIRRLPDLDGKPFKIARACGAHLTDTSGSTYIDFAMAMGATILGHASPPVVEACIGALRNGSMPGFSHDGEMQAAEALARLAPALTRATFVTTGSEAVHLACRIARRSTGRPVIAKIAGGFDGWYDDLAIGWSGSPEADLSGPRPVIRDMTLLRFNDLADVEALFAERSDIAAVIVEPMLANAGSLRAEPRYFKELTRIARRNGAMVIADEVLMGLRLGCGVSCSHVGLEPDLVTLGKAIGSGLPVAAVLGTAEAFAAVEDGRAPRAGTYHGNPLVTAAVKATIDTLQSMDYAAFLDRGDRLRRSIEAAMGRIGPACTSGYGSVFSLWFSERPPASYDEAKQALRPDLSARLHLELRRRGVVTIPGGWGRIFLSFAHTQDDLDRTAAAFEEAARHL